MTRMFSSTGALWRAMGAVAISGFCCVSGGCETGTTEPPSDQTTMDLSNVPPPEATPAAAPAPAPAPITPPIAQETTPPPAPAQRTHTITKGDTIFSLAAKYYGSGNKANQEKILAANPGLVPTRMTIGKTVVIP